MKVPMVTTESGLQYKDIKVGSGPTPPVGYQVCGFDHTLLIFFFYLKLDVWNFGLSLTFGLWCFDFIFLP